MDLNIIPNSIDKINTIFQDVNCLMMELNNHLKERNVRRSRRLPFIKMAFLRHYFPEWSTIRGTENIKWCRKRIALYNLEPAKFMMYAYSLDKAMPYVFAFALSAKYMLL